MFKTLREELTYYDGAFYAIMITKHMSEADHTVFQYALDSIDYILKSQKWLDDEWVMVGFKNIEKAKALLFEMLKEDNFSEKCCMSRARDILGNTEGNYPMRFSLPSEEQQQKIANLKKYAGRAIQSHNEKCELRNMRSLHLRKNDHGGHGRC